MERPRSKDVLPTERPRSKDVLAVMGRLCIDEDFRADFFVDPRGAAQAFVGELSPSELEQIDDLGGNGEMPDGQNREMFVPQAQSALGNVYSAYDCPERPCPGRGDPGSPLAAKAK
jgi:hypothetical protein